MVKSDRRCASVAAAVDFAKSNNLLGILVNAFILVRWAVHVRRAYLLTFRADQGSVVDARDQGCGNSAGYFWDVGQGRGGATRDGSFGCSHAEWGIDICGSYVTDSVA